MMKLKVDFSDKGKALRAIEAACVAGVRAASLEAEAAVKRSFSKGARFSSSSPGTPPNVQRGQLRNRVQAIRSNTLKGGVISGAPYSRILEHGGTIVPKTGKYLAVPVTQKAKRLSEKLAGASLRSQNLVFIPRRKGPLLVGKGAKKDLVFVLKKSVTILPRPFFRVSIEKAIPKMQAAFSRASKAALGVV